MKKPWESMKFKQTFYKDGYLHREDGPAKIDEVGTKWWYLNGKLHRIGGPAVEHANGDNSWWVNGERHRTDGPAITISSSLQRRERTEYWYRGKQIDKSYFLSDEFKIQITMDE